MQRSNVCVAGGYRRRSPLHQRPAVKLEVLGDLACGSTRFDFIRARDRGSGEAQRECNVEMHAVVEYDDGKPTALTANEPISNSPEIPQEIRPVLSSCVLK